MKGALRTPDGLHEFLELCGPYVDQKPAAPKDLDDVTAIVKVVPKKRKKSDDDEEVTAAMPRTPKKSKRGH